MDWLTSDTHFGHSNIAIYSDRPWKTLLPNVTNPDGSPCYQVHTIDMDRELIENINRLVKPDDRLFHLGDFAFKNPGFYRRQIKCKNMYSVFGNHDKDNPEFRSLFKEITIRFETTLGDGVRTRKVVLDHYAMRVWNRSHHGVYHAYGHSHGSLPDDPHSLSMDVGVDSVAEWFAKAEGVPKAPKHYRPISASEFFDWMEAKEKDWKPIDHHTGTRH
jgi:calcineurin-like phosphoesterase family protein